MNKKLMAHIVYGYPKAQTSENMIVQMDAMGVEYIEVQIPFSDPMADGPILSHANSEASKSSSTDNVLSALGGVTPHLQQSQILVMCYFQSIFAYGIQPFCAKAAAANVAGLIVPDLPYDQPGYDELAAGCVHNGLVIIPVLSPNMSRTRLRHYIGSDTQLAYVTARIGVTGAHTDELQTSQIVEFIGSIKSINPSCEIALGFGIQTTSDIENLPANVAIAVVGSAITASLTTRGETKTVAFIKQLLGACRQA